MQNESNNPAALRIDFAPRDALRAVGARLLALPVAILALGILAALDWLPAPRALENMEEAVLTAKAELARSDRPSSWLAIGDSACMMNFDPRALTDSDGASALNLGTWRQLSFDAYAEFVRARDAVGRTPKKILLILHPSTLRRSDSDGHALDLLNALLHDAPRPRKRFGSFAIRAADTARDRILNRVFARPIPAAFAAQHGHAGRLARDLVEADGFLSAPDSIASRMEGRPDYYLAPGASERIAAFRAATGDAELFIALSPTPRALALRDTEERVARLSAELAEKLSPARALALPALWDDRDFYDTVHLRPAGRMRWQQRVVDALNNAP